MVPFGDGKIIVVRESEDTFAAVGSTCSHYGAPLINGQLTHFKLEFFLLFPLFFNVTLGVVYKGYISCPWHGACFNLHSGDIEEFPGCDSIPAYGVGQ